MQGVDPLRRPRAALAAAVLALVASVGGIVVVVATWNADRPPPDVGTTPVVAPAPASRSLLAAGALTIPVPLPRADRLRPVPTHPARLDAHANAPPVRPVRLSIEPAGIVVEVVAVGVDSTGQAMALPPDASVAAWYEHGPAPGEAGSAVIAGHVDFGGRPGAFVGLAHVDPGASVTVELEDGSTRRFTVTARRTYAKDALPVADLFRRHGASTLALVTCGGDFDPTAQSYRANVVVYAEPAP